MASRSRAPRRRESDSDTADSVKPLVVLVLLGTIMYGAWSVVTRGPGGLPGEASRADLSAAPQFATSTGVPAPPPAEMPSAFPVTPPGPAAPVAPAMPALAASPPGGATLPASPPTDASPTYLSAVPALPPVADTAPASPPAFPPAAAATPAAESPPQSLAAPLDPRQMPPTGSAASRTAAFASTWADAHDKLAAGRYAEALAVLSLWYDDPSLGPEESQRLEDLLGQLAGTVIYSPQDLLLPPYIVEPGETLVSIAAPLGVPWQILAKINGIADPSRLVPGEALKMIRGPFDGIVSISRRRLSLQVGTSYAGSFPVVVGRQLRDRVGGSLSVLATQQDAAADQAGATPVAWAQAGPRTITLSDGIVIEAVADPTLNAEENIAPTSLVVSDRDLAELADILGPGSRVLIRR
jgi:hypothetical protein